MPIPGKGRCLWVTCLLSFGAVTPSEATVVRAIALNELVAASDAVVIATATQARSHYAYVGSARRVVTDTELQVEQVVFTKPKQAADEEAWVLSVRSSGGIVGDLVYHVYGEAMLTKGARCLLFLRKGADGYHHVTGRAQGEYRLAPDDRDARAGWVLHPSRGLDAVLNAERSAVRVLAGRSFGQAADLILQVATQSGQLRGVS
ncbi:MAG TPA: hypothetical protein VKP30_33665 [Polyangiaceae bacterium]|nr:hypothetical protein [Polyangiaceae bacterium]